MWYAAQCLARGKRSSTITLGSFMFLCACLHTCVHAFVTGYACVCMSLSLCIWINMWVCGFVRAAVNCVGLLFRSVFFFFCIVPVCGCCIHSALAGQCQQVPMLGGCGEGCSTQPQAMASFGLAKKAVVPVPHHFLPLLLFHWLPQSRLFLIISLVPSLSQGQIEPLSHPSLPAPSSPTLPSEHPAWKASVAPPGSCLARP